MSSFTVPMDASASVAYIISKADITEFDVEHAGTAETTTFIFKNDAERVIAADLVYHEFESQIDEGINGWDVWDAGLLSEEPAEVWGGSPLAKSRPVASWERPKSAAQFEEIDNPVCICKHPFYDHDHDCDNCDCIGFTPAKMLDQVNYATEHRSFGRKGKSVNPAVYQKGDSTLKVHFNGEGIGKVELTGENSGSGQGWEGLNSLLQAFGD